MPAETKVAKADTVPSKVPPEGELPTKPADVKPANAADPATPAAPGEKTSEPSTNIPGGTGTSPTKTPAGTSSAGTTADNMTAPDSGSPAVPPELLAQAREAKEQFDKGNYRDAEKTYEKILQKAPKNLYILSNLGVVLFRGGKLARAEEAFKKAIAIAPEDAFSRCTLGIVFYSQNKFDEAVNELTKALAINPKNATAHNYLGITASQKGWQEAAQKELETAVAIDPQYADAHFNLAVVFATMQPPQKELARKHYQLATSLGAEPDNNLEQLIK
jgi:Tfp pilus assembly protein PilF